MVPLSPRVQTVADLLAAAKAGAASQVVVVATAPATPFVSTAPTGFFAAFTPAIPAAAAPNAALSKAEQLVKASGLPFIVVRAQGVATADEAACAEQGVKVAGFAAISPSLVTSKQQVGAWGRMRAHGGTMQRHGERRLVAFIRR